MRRALSLLLTALALALAGCGGDGAPSGGSDETLGTSPDETTSAGTTPATTEATQTGEEPGGTAPNSGDPVAGEELFAQNGCGGCHALAAAGATGGVGPDLDESKPAYDLAVARITRGKGSMPAFGDQLSDEQIANLAAYVVESTKG